MSWPIAGDWLAVAGLILLTFGTGAQAWFNLAEFRSLRRTVSEVASNTLTGMLATGVRTIHSRMPAGAVRTEGGLPRRRYGPGSRLSLRLLLVMAPLVTMAQLPRKLFELRAEGAMKPSSLRASSGWPKYGPSS